jgi:hypothetical protein
VFHGWKDVPGTGIFIVIFSICAVRRNMPIKKCALLEKLFKDECVAML